MPTFAVQNFAGTAKEKQARLSAIKKFSL